MVLFGLWFGTSLGTWEFAGPQEAFALLLFVPFWFALPTVLIAAGVTLVAWYLPIRMEWPYRSRIAAASVNLVAWLVAGWTYALVWR
jgi:hypothetical protein